MVSDKLPQNEHVDEKENQTGNPYVDHGVTALKLQIVCWGEPDGLQKPHQTNKQTNKQTTEVRYMAYNTRTSVCTTSAMTHKNMTYYMMTSEQKGHLREGASYVGPQDGRIEGAKGWSRCL